MISCFEDLVNWSSSSTLRNERGYVRRRHVHREEMFTLRRHLYWVHGFFLEHFYILYLWLTEDQKLSFILNIPEVRRNLLSKVPAASLILLLLPSLRVKLLIYPTFIKPILIYVFLSWITMVKIQKIQVLQSKLLMMIPPRCSMVCLERQNLRGLGVSTVTQFAHQLLRASNSDNPVTVGL